MTDQPRTFRVEQLGPPRGRNAVQTNEAVGDLDDLVTHHPGANRDIRMEAGRIREAEDQQPTYRGGDRSYAFIDGEFQETIDSTDRYDSLREDQVLLVKDFILEDPVPPRGTDNRAVGVPSPTAGYVSRIQAGGGLVEIMDREDGDVIARVRHLNPISVRQGDTVEYGQTLGTQNRQGLVATAGKHVHVEMDTGHFQQLANYLDDLADGRTASAGGISPECCSTGSGRRHSSPRPGKRPNPRRAACDGRRGISGCRRHAIGSGWRVSTWYAGRAARLSARAWAATDRRHRSGHATLGARDNPWSRGRCTPCKRTQCARPS